MEEQVSALHLISAIINAPRFHRDLSSCPVALTERCVHLLTTLGRNRGFAIKANFEMVEFLTNAIQPYDDAGYMRVSRHFVQELLTVIGAQHKIWGAISYVMLSIHSAFENEKDLIIWQRMNARFFEVMLDCGVISEEEERKFKARGSLLRDETRDSLGASFIKENNTDKTGQNNKSPAVTSQGQVDVSPAPQEIQSGVDQERETTPPPSQISSLSAQSGNRIAQNDASTTPNNPIELNEGQGGEGLVRVDQAKEGRGGEDQVEATIVGRSIKVMSIKPAFGGS